MKSFCLTLALSILAFNLTRAQISFKKHTAVQWEVQTPLIRAFYSKEGDHIKQEYFALNGKQWQKVVSSFHSPDDFPAEAVQLFNRSINKGFRFLVEDIVDNLELVRQTQNTIVIKLSGTLYNTKISQFISFDKNKSYCHIETGALLNGKPAKLDYLLSSFQFELNRPPFFIHTPGVKFDNEDSKQNRYTLLPAKDQVIGDRAFHAPAVILQEKNLFAALVPDLNAINQYAVVSPDARRTIDIERNIFSVPVIDSKYTMPTGIDLNVKTGLTEKPIFSFGIMDNIIAHHIHYQRKNDSSMIRTLNSNEVRYAFDLFVSADKKSYDGYETIARHQWKEFGHPVFENKPHLAMPMQEYFHIVDSITFHPGTHEDIDIPLKGYDDHGSWLEFDMNGIPVGGYRSAINWWNDVIHNSQFWNNARDASGFWFWGKQLNRNDLIDKAHRIINFCLQAPRNADGLFATLYSANEKKWGLQFSDPPNGKNEFFLKESHSYDIVAMSKTAAHLLDYYLRCEKDERIVRYLTPYADWALTAINERGAVPSFVTEEMKPSDILLYSAQPASTMWFLSSMYLVTKQEKYKAGAEKIAAYFEKEILPGAKWLDMEQYFSCGNKPLNFERDLQQNEYCRGNLALIWASEAFARLYEATQNMQYLKDGEETIDYLSFSQCSWNPHYIYTAFPFGGFTADNADNATFLDARQAETVKPFIWYGKQLGRQDLVERGVAAAKSSAVLMNLPAHKENGIYAYTNIYPYGLGPENIDHEAHPQSPMRTSPSWGEGSGVFTGLAEALRELNGAYINAEKKIAVPVDGLSFSKVSFKKNEIIIRIKNELNNLKLPWNHSFETALQLDGLANKYYRIVVNGQAMVVKGKSSCNLHLKVLPYGMVVLDKKVNR